MPPLPHRYNILFLGGAESQAPGSRPWIRHWIITLLVRIFSNEKHKDKKKYFQTCIRMHEYICMVKKSIGLG